MNIISAKLLFNGVLNLPSVLESYADTQSQMNIEIILEFINLLRPDLHITKDTLNKFFDECFKYYIDLHIKEVNRYADKLKEDNFKINSSDLSHRIKKLRELNIPELHGVLCLLLLLAERDNEVKQVIDSFDERTFGYKALLFTEMKVGDTTFYDKYKEELFKKFIATKFNNKENLNINVKQIIQDNITTIISKSDYVENINNKLYYVDPKIIYYLFDSINYADITNTLTLKDNFDEFSKMIILAISFFKKKVEPESELKPIIGIYTITPLKEVRHVEPVEVKPEPEPKNKGKEKGKSRPKPEPEPILLKANLSNARIYESNIEGSNYIAFIDHTYDNKPIALYNICNADNPDKNQYIYEFLVYLKRKYPESKYLKGIKISNKAEYKLKFSPIYLVKPDNDNISVFNAEQEDISLRQLRLVNSFFIYTINNVEELDLSKYDDTNNLSFSTDNYESNILLNSITNEHIYKKSTHETDQFAKDIYYTFINEQTDAAKIVERSDNHKLLDDINKLSDYKNTFFAYSVEYDTYVNAFMSLNTLSYLHDNKANFGINEFKFNRLRSNQETLFAQDLTGIDYLYNGGAYCDLFNYFFLPDDEFKLYIGSETALKSPKPTTTPPTLKYTLSFADSTQFNVDYKKCELINLYNTKIEHKKASGEKIKVAQTAEPIKRLNRYVMSFIYFDNTLNENIFKKLITGGKESKYNKYEFKDRMAKVLKSAYKSINPAFDLNHELNPSSKTAFKLKDYNIENLDPLAYVDKQQKAKTKTSTSAASAIVNAMIKPNSQYDNHDKKWMPIMIEDKRDAFVMCTETKPTNYSKEVNYKILCPHNMYASKGNINEIININNYILGYTIDPTNKYGIKLLTPQMKLIFNLTNLYDPVHQYLLKNNFNNSFHNVYLNTVEFLRNTSPLAFEYHKQQPAEGLDSIRNDTQQLIYNKSEDIYNTIFSFGLDKLKFVKKVEVLNESI